MNMPTSPVTGVSRNAGLVLFDACPNFIHIADVAAIWYCRSSVGERGGDVCIRRGLGQVDQQLHEAALGRSIVAQHVGEGGIAERLGEALAQGLASASVVAQTEAISKVIDMEQTRTARSSARRA